jgi:dephospho-CoA kinase
MLHIGLTGNIGSGKTVVASIFSTLGVPVFHADLEARKLYNLDIVKDKIRNLFGDGVFSPSGDILRPRLAGIVFSNKDMLDHLNEIIHPAVRQNYLDWCGQFPEKPYSLYEAAILFESGHYKAMDKVICVTAPEELRIRRVMERDGISRNETENRIANQWQEEQKIALADFVIRNDGSEPVIGQVLEVHRRIVGKG